MEHLQELKIISWKKTENTFEITWPELIEIADEYTKKVRLRVGSKSVVNDDIIPIHKRERIKKERPLSDKARSEHIQKIIEEMKIGS